MSLPTRDEIFDEAVRLFMSENPGAPVPEEDELKEGNYWLRARDALMRGYRGELEGALGMYEEEVEKIREALGIAPPPEREELEARLDTITTSFETTRDRLKSAREEIKRLERELEEARKPTPEEVVSKILPQAIEIIGLLPPSPEKSDFQAMVKGLESALLRKRPITEIEVTHLRDWIERLRPPPAPPPRIHATRVEVIKTTDYTTPYSIMFSNIEKYGDRPILYAIRKTIKEVEELLGTGEERYDIEELGLRPEQFEGEEWYEELPAELKSDAVIYWTAEDIVWEDEAQADRITWHKTFTRDDLEALKVDEVRNVCRVKGLSTEGRKAELINRILGVAPPPEKPPEVPPEVPVKPLIEVPKPIEVGLQKADEEMLRDLFLTKLMEGSLGHSAARGHLPEFRLLLGKVREAWKDVPRERAFSESRSDVESLVESIVARRPPVRVRRPPVRPLREPEEVPPVFPVPIVVPIAPPPGLIRRWGMPFALHTCPACMGEDKPLEECMQYSSPYLNSRLRRMGVPTSDPLFFKLCDEHRRKYGGAYELFPRYKTEFWVGEVVAKGEIDISVMVGMGVSEEYVFYSIAFYDEAKHLAVQ